jgi:hypothetical protein
MDNLDRVLILLTLVSLTIVLASALVLLSPHEESYVEVSTVARNFAATHTYVEHHYDCDEASIDLANEYRALGYNATLMIGNPLEDVHGDLYKINHAWVMINVRGRWLAVESTKGELNVTSPLYYNGWPVMVDDYDTWCEEHLDQFNPVPMQSYPVPFEEIP